MIAIALVISVLGNVVMFVLTAMRITDMEARIVERQRRLEIAIKEAHVNLAGWSQQIDNRLAPPPSLGVYR